MKTNSNDIIKPFIPEIGKTYTNKNKGEYICVNIQPDEGVTMRHTTSGWQIITYGISKYPDGTIEWDYSTNGHFVNEPEKPQKFYKMCAVFSISLVPKHINDVLDKCHLDGKLVIKDVGEIKLTQTVPFIPNDDILHDYEEIIKNGYNKNNDEFTCTECKFKHYEYLKECEV